MVQIRVQTRGMDFSRMAQELEQDIRDLKKNTLESMASTIAQVSPVDSGFYARNHQVAMRSGSFAAMKQRPDSAPRRSKGQAVDEAAARTAGLQSMMSGIASIDLDGESFVFRNPMSYSALVEAEHAVYGRTIRETAAIIDQEIARIAARNR